MLQGLQGPRLAWAFPPPDSIRGVETFRVHGTGTNARSSLPPQGARSLHGAVITWLRAPREPVGYVLPTSGAWLAAADLPTWTRTASRQPWCRPIGEAGTTFPLLVHSLTCALAVLPNSEAILRLRIVQQSRLPRDAEQKRGSFRFMLESEKRYRLPIATVRCGRLCPQLAGRSTKPSEAAPTEQQARPPGPPP